MCNPPLNPIVALGSGAINGRYRQTTQTTHGNPLNAPDPGNTGAQAFIAQHNAIAQAAYTNQAASYAGYANQAPGVLVPFNGFVGALTSLSTAAPPFEYKPPKVEDAGITAGEIIAWRCWRVDDNATVLMSAFIDSQWCPDSPMSEADIKNHGYGHGVHAWKSERKAYQYGCQLGVEIAYGTVMLWGEVYEYEMGYRAEFGKVKSIKGIINPTRDPVKTIEQLNKIYGEHANDRSYNQGSGDRRAEGGEGPWPDQG